MLCLEFYLHSEQVVHWLYAQQAIWSECNWTYGLLRPVWKTIRCVHSKPFQV